MQIVSANPRGFHAGVEHTYRAAGACPVVVAPAVSMPAAGAVA